MTRTKSTDNLSRLRNYARVLALSVLTSAAVLLVVDHWQRFDTSDFLLLGAVFVSACIYWLLPAPCKTARKKHWVYKPAKWRRH